MGGKFLSHITGAMKRAGRRAGLAAVSAGVAGIVLAEVLDCVTGHHFPPSGAAQLVAAALGIALAYAAGTTTVVLMLLESALSTVSVVEADLRFGAVAAEVRASQSVASELSRHTSGSSPQAPAPVIGNAPRPGDEPAEDIAHKLPELPPLPVRADRLPRIEWAEAENSVTLPPSWPTNMATTSVPIAVLSQRPVANGDSDMESSERDTDPVPVVVPTRSPASSALGASVSSESGDSVAVSPAALSRFTRPISSVTRPLAAWSMPEGSPPSGNLWERLSQALITRDQDLPAADDDSSASPVSAEDEPTQRLDQ